MAAVKPKTSPPKPKYQKTNNSSIFSIFKKLFNAIFGKENEKKKYSKPRKYYNKNRRYNKNYKYNKYKTNNRKNFLKNTNTKNSD